MSFNFSVPTNALFGAGKLGELHTQINTPMGAVHGRKALVVISNGKSTRTNGYLDRLENELKQSNVEYVIFDKVGSNPTKPVVEEGGRFAKENGCDFIVALGGGSVMDASKAIGIMATNESDDLWDYVMFGTGKKQWPPMPSLPIVAITTTAGTGSETDGGGVITNPETQEKTGVYVPQGNTLFSGTLRENFCMFTEKATDEEIMKVAQIACIDEFILNLKEGLDTLIGERGMGLSEGQAQRIAVARALLSDAPVLLLDESTSALDERTEAELLKNIHCLKDKTCLIVTHRRAALDICNRRIDMENINKRGSDYKIR